MAEVMTIFEAGVVEDDWLRLQEAWDRLAQNRPDQVVRSWLVQGLDGADTWCAVTLWRSREALQEYQESVDLLPPNAVFRELGITPVLAAFEVIAEG